MKINLLLAHLFFAFGISCAQNANAAFLSIHLYGFNAEKHLDFADVILPDVANPFSTRLNVSDAGIVSGYWDISSTREALFIYDEKEISIIISPGDSVSIRLDIEVLKRFDGPITSTTFGKHARANALILEHAYYLKKNLEEAALELADFQDETEYKMARENLMVKHLARLDDTISFLGITDVYFIQWAKALLIYGAYSDISMFPYFVKKSKVLDDHIKYFDFTSKLNPEDEFVASTQSWTGCMDYLITSLLMTANTNVAYQAPRESLKKYNLSYFPFHYKMLTQRLSGSLKRAALRHLYFRGKNMPDLYQDSILLQLPELKNEIRYPKEDISRQTIIQLLNSSKLDSADKDSLLAIYQEAQGKVVFHDFWMEWCAACLIEFKHYNNLIDQAGDDVVFLFLTSDTDNERWRNTLDKYKLKGKHILLSDHQMAFYKKYFYVWEYPQHRMVSPSGLIQQKIQTQLTAHNAGIFLKEIEAVRKQ